MNPQKNKFYVTTPIYYVTAKPHLGHLYSTVIADVLARWHKLKNDRTLFLTGTDEFGQKIAQAAEKAGKDPQSFVNSFIDAYKNVWKEYDVAYDIFMRTTNDFHIKAVQKWILQLIEKGDIYKSFYKGWYCTHDETFVTEFEQSETAPHCPSCGRETHWVSEEAYFFKLSAYENKLLKFYEENPNFIVPKERAHEVINFVKSGLKDLSISRTTVKWGVPFPNDPNHVTYVWADALNNYITAIGYAQKDKEKDFQSWWPADVQVMGKDIIRFHAVYWPAFLMASGLPLPKHLLVHGWFKVGEQKMSKSLGNVIDPQVLYQAYGPDPVRYYLMRQMAITHDGEFTTADLKRKISSDLADDLGNLLNRMSTLALKYNLKELVPPYKWSKSAHELYEESLLAVKEYHEHMNEFMFHMALARLWKFISQTNAYFHSQEPWRVATKDPAAFAEILSATAHALQTIGTLLWPVMPQKMEQLLASIGVTLDLNANHIEQLSKNPWKRTFMISKIDTLFVKPAEEINSETVAVAVAPVDDSIDIQDFAKVKLMVGTIEQCQEVSGSDKLYQLHVDLGATGKRQILSGVRKYFKPEELIGKQAVFVVNLKPRKMMGMESQGMMLTAGDEHNFSVLSPNSKIANGTILK